MLALAAPAVGVIVLAEVGRHLPLLTAAFILASFCAVSRPVVGAAVLLVAASDPLLFRADALGPLTAVDVVLATVVARSVIAGGLDPPGWLEWCALGFIAAGVVATAVAHEASSPTAFARVASYVFLGLAVGRALAVRDRLMLARAFVGAQVGQALAALTSVTGTIGTGFPFGRYLGTLGDPAQFGIPIAFAAVLLAFSPHIVRDRFARTILLVILLAAVAGSVTRSAWSVAGVGILLALVMRFSTGHSLRTRVTFAFGAATTLLAGTVLVVVGASLLGLNRQSADLRRRSIETGWTYLIQHPLHPLGLGNHPKHISANETAPVGTTPRAARCLKRFSGREAAPAAAAMPNQRSCSDLATNVTDPRASANVNLVPDSSFENRPSGWIPYRGAHLRRRVEDARFGRSWMRVTAPGVQLEEGVATSSPIRGIQGRATYTFSIYAKVPRDVLLWLYIDEFDASGQWLGYGYTPFRGKGVWSRFSRTWTTASATAEARLFVVTGARMKTIFSVDAAQLNPGETAHAYVDSRRRVVIEGSVIYNTWLAVAIGLGLVAAAFLLVLAAGVTYNAYRFGDYALSLALVAMLVPSFTENFVYGANIVTLVWLGTLGLAASARVPAGGHRPSTP
jgi:hypothetical protein